MKTHSSTSISLVPRSRLALQQAMAELRESVLELERELAFDWPSPDPGQSARGHLQLLEGGSQESDLPRRRPLLLVHPTPTG